MLYDWLNCETSNIRYDNTIPYVVACTHQIKMFFFVISCPEFTRICLDLLWTNMKTSYYVYVFFVLVHFIKSSIFALRSQYCADTNLAQMFSYSSFIWYPCLFLLPRLLQDQGIFSGLNMISNSSWGFWNSHFMAQNKCKEFQTTPTQIIHHKYHKNQQRLLSRRRPALYTSWNFLA